MDAISGWKLYAAQCRGNLFVGAVVNAWTEYEEGCLKGETRMPSSQEIATIGGPLSIVQYCFVH